MLRLDLPGEVEEFASCKRSEGGLVSVRLYSSQVSSERHDDEWALLPAAKQPDWQAHHAYQRIRLKLSAAQPLVSPIELHALEHALAAVVNGSARVLQLGDCAESFYDCTPEHIRRKLDVLDGLAEALDERGSFQVVRIGRMGGQFAKPRSSGTEVVNGVELPAFRGHMINSEAETLAARQHDPRRMLWAYEASASVLGALREQRECSTRTSASLLRTGPWSSHEALVIDYEGSLVRVDPMTGERYLGSTHLPWIGERTRQLDHAHVGLLASVRNPMGCKIGPNAPAGTVLRLCELLNPERVPGRLSLIIRMGREHVEEALPPIVDAVASSRHPVVWLSDPMHGNTVRASCGLKTRYLTDIAAESVAFRRILEDRGQHPGGLHLEVAASDVTECVGGSVADETAISSHYTSLCDPRLNPEQALELINTVFS